MNILKKISELWKVDTSHVDEIFKKAAAKKQETMDKITSDYPIGTKLDYLGRSVTVVGHHDYYLAGFENLRTEYIPGIWVKWWDIDMHVKKIFIPWAELSLCEKVDNAGAK